MTPPATVEEVEEVLGDIDVFTLERILDTHATADEIAQALADLDEERRDGEQREPSSARVVEVRTILEQAMTEEDDDESYAS